MSFTMLSTSHSQVCRIAFVAVRTAVAAELEALFVAAKWSWMYRMSTTMDYNISTAVKTHINSGM
jgi:hypothetical protein